MWESKFDTAFWTATMGSWNGSAWVPGRIGSDRMLKLTPAGTWHQGYRPEKIKISLSGASPTLNVQDTYSSVMESVDFITSGQEITLNYPNNADIKELIFHNSVEDFLITDIQFPAPEPEPEPEPEPVPVPVIPPQQSVIFEGDITETRTARITRDMTLDGGASIADYGVSDGDRTFDISGRVSQEAENFIADCFQNDRRIIISTSEGIFTAYLESFTRDPMRIKILVEGAL